VKKHLTSDWHVGEKPTPNTHSFLRPRMTEQMVYEWIEQCHKLIKPDDELIFVGDVGIALADLAMLRYLPPCRKILILGDKEYGNKIFDKAAFLAENERLGIFNEVVENAVIDISGREYFFSHKPVDCLKQDRPAICGHVHGIWRTARMPNGQPIINVGIDAWGGLVSEEFLEHQYNCVTKGYYDANCFPAQWTGQ
jgi:calcineurin-like phosphoesterase family protein